MRTAVGAAVCLAAFSADAQRSTGEIESAYLDETLVEFTISEPAKGEREFRMGPWKFGTRVAGGAKPRDKRLNLYLVSPGKQHRAEGLADFDHNDVINALPVKEGPVEWDVYWAIVLDPALTQDLRSERALLLQAQERFDPGDLFEFEDLPGRAMLRTFLHVKDLTGLARFRSADGRLPRLIIHPAGFAVRAAAAAAAPAAQKSGEAH